MIWIARIFLAIVLAGTGFAFGFRQAEKIQEHDRSFHIQMPKGTGRIQETHPIGENIKFHQHITIFPSGETKLIEYYTEQDSMAKIIKSTNPVVRELTDEEMEHFRHLPMLNKEEFQ